MFQYNCCYLIKSNINSNQQSEEIKKIKCDLCKKSGKLFESEMKLRRHKNFCHVGKW